MILIIGLGNPGKKYERTRHNAGFMAIDAIAANFQFPIFKFQSIFNAEISKGKIADKEIVLVKPQTFMNNSGQAVKLLAKTYKLKPNNLIIIHDDIDLPLGKIKITKNRGAGGHKGVESVIRELKTKNFIRLRIGIQPKFGKPQKAETFVLKNFTKEEEKILKEIIKKTAETIQLLLKKGLEKAMNEYNK